MRLAMTIGFGLLMGCAAPGAHSGPTSPAGQAGQNEGDAEALAAVRSVHGGVGPWVVAGYRMGRYALSVLGLARGSFELEVVHHAPPQVQYSCIADGAAAATGASLGRLNLSLQASSAERTRTTYRNRHSGASVTLQATEAFAQRYLDVPRSALGAAGAEVLRLPDAAIFREVAVDDTPEAAGASE